MISVIIPNYNHGPYLDDRIASVLSQTYQDIEVIILDDCSIDTSKAIIAKYQNHPKVKKVLYNDQNRGSVFEQWVKGLRYCEGEYVWIAESDDSAEKQFLEELIKPFEHNTEMVLSYSDALIVDGDSKLIGKWSDRRNDKFNTKRWSEDYSNKGSTEIKEFLIYGTTINNISAVLIKKSAIDRNTLMILQTFKYVGDWYFYLSILIKGDLHYCAKGLAFYREHDKNISHNGIKTGEQFIETLRAYKLFLNKIIDIDIVLDKKGVLNYFTYRFNNSINSISQNGNLKIKWITNLIIHFPRIMTMIIWKWLKHKLKNK